MKPKTTFTLTRVNDKFKCILTNEWITWLWKYYIHWSTYLWILHHSIGIINKKKLFTYLHHCQNHHDSNHLLNPRGNKECTTYRLLRTWRNKNTELSLHLAAVTIYEVIIVKDIFICKTKYKLITDVNQIDSRAFI